EFIERLGTGVGPSTGGGRSDHAVIALGKGNLLALAIDLAGRGQQDGTTIAGTELEDIVGPADDRLDRLDRLVHDQLHAHRAGQMEYSLGFGHAALDDGRVDDAGDPQLEARSAFEMRDVLITARAEVVEHQ